MTWNSCKLFGALLAYNVEGFSKVHASAKEAGFESFLWKESRMKQKSDLLVKSGKTKD